VHAFTPQLVGFSDPHSDEILVGTNQGPYFTIYNQKGEEQRRVMFDFPPRDVSDDLKAEIKEASWLKQGNYEVVFPDKLPFYTGVFPVKDRGYLVHFASPIYRNVWGVLVDREGRALGRFYYECGESGGIESVGGRLFAVKTDDMGEYSICELIIE
jgi:hypothetical protein